MSESMKWVESAGGPLILIQEVVRLAWNGAESQGSDYDRACAVSDELGVIPINETDALVLGDEPHRTTCLNENGQTLLVRWVAARSEGDIKDAIRHLSDADFGHLEVNMDVRDEKLVLMDSAQAGRNADDKALRFRLPVASYTVGTAVIRTKDIHIILHRFRRGLYAGDAMIVP